MRKFIVDRIEDGRATLEAENGEHIEVDKSEIPDGTNAGEVLKKEGEGFAQDPIETEKRRDTVRNLLKGLIGEKDK